MQRQFLVCTRQQGVKKTTTLDEFLRSHSKVLKSRDQYLFDKPVLYA